MTEKLRPVWKFVPVQCTLADIKAGDIYQMGKRDDDDIIDDGQLWIARTDAKPDTERGYGSVVMADPIVVDVNAETPGFEKRPDNACGAV
jgi:hypothetical protein